MKVRIQANNIRFRLKEHETKALLQHGSISEVMEFGTDPEEQLSFKLLVADGQDFRVRFDRNTIVFHIPGAVVANWVNTNEAGFGEDIDTGKGKIIRILVEKDFPCLHEKQVGSSSGIQFH